MINRLFPLKMITGPTGRSPKFLRDERATRPYIASLFYLPGVKLLIDCLALN